MIVPDLNLLIYAVNEESRHHDDAGIHIFSVACLSS